MRSIPDAAKELQAFPQWVCWYIKQDRDSRTTKPPISPTVSPTQPLEERLASPSNPATWGTYQQALRMSCYYAGIGFMFSEHDPYCGIDLDKCRNPQSGSIAKWAMNIISLFGSYSEISPSGTGIHIIIRASLLTTIEKLDRVKLQHKHGHIEIYDSKRYFTWSGNHLEGIPTSIESRQDELTDLYQATFPEEEKHKGGNVPAPTSSSIFSLPDAWIIERAKLARGGRGALFECLMSGDASDFRRSDGSIDHSRADQCLLGILAYWTGRDAARMESLFQQSGLYRPERWREPSRGGETYGQTSIRLAIATCYRVYDPEWAQAHRYQSPPKRTMVQKTPVSQNSTKGEK